MARTKYTVTFPAAKAGDEVTWPNSVKVYADANIDRPMGNGYIEAAAGSFTAWSDAASVTFTRAGTDSVTVTAGSPTGTGVAVPTAASGATSEKGAWVPSTVYAVGDVVTYVGQRWTRKTAGTSGSTFDFTQWVKMGSAAVIGRGYIVPAGALDNTAAALKLHASQRVELVALGDSTTWGSAGTSWFQQRLKANLLAAGVTDGGHGFHNAADDAGYPTYTDDGTYPRVSARTGWGAGNLSLSGYSSTTTNDSISLQFRGTAVRLNLGVTSTGGKLGYSIDGGSETVFDGFVSITSVSRPYATRTVYVGGLTEGVHTLTVVNRGGSDIRNAGLTATGSVSSGGSLAIATYYYWLTITSASGESTATALGPFTTNGVNKTVGGIQFMTDYGQTGYKLYRSTTNDPATSQLIKTASTASVGTTTNVFDDGTGTPSAGNPPGSSTLGQMTTNNPEFAAEFLRTAGVVLHKDAYSGATVQSFFDNIGQSNRAFTPRRLGLKTEDEVATDYGYEFWRLPKGVGNAYRSVTTVFLQLGTNDVTIGSPTSDNQYLTNLNNYVENLALALRSARSAGSDVILISPPFNSATTPGENHQQGHFKAALVSLALAHGCAYVDFQEALGYGYGVPGTPHVGTTAYNVEADFIWTNVIQPALSY